MILTSTNGNSIAICGTRELNLKNFISIHNSIF